MQASEEVSRMDASSGQSLEEVTAMVDTINGRIKGRKDVLAPKIKELRKARAQMADLSAAHEEARDAYHKVQDTHDSRLAELEGQVASLQAAVDEVRLRRAARCSAACCVHAVRGGAGCCHQCALAKCQSRATCRQDRRGR